MLARWIDAGSPGRRASRSPGPGPCLPLKPRQPDLPPAVDGRDQPDRPDRRRLLRRAQGRAAGSRSTTRLPPPRLLDLSACCRRPSELDAFLADTGAGQAANGSCAGCSTTTARYAEHWLTFWNDLLRNDYRGTGYIDGGRKQITAWLYQVASARTSRTTSSSAS